MLNIKYEFKGKCIICNRDMYDDGFSIDQHHFLPKSRGGIEKLFIHRCCHQKIHSLWTVKELEKEFSNPDVIKNHEDMQSFLIWIQKKDCLFYQKSISTNKKKKKSSRG